MISKTKNLFVSYRSTDSTKVDPLVHRLRSLGYQVWQDKDCIPAGQDWWEAICEGIVSCDVFIFMLSEKSVKSFACLAELSYAHELNLPIIPFVIEGQWTYNVGGKYDINFWSDIPEELEESRAQFLFYEGVSFVDRLKQGIDTLLAKNMPRLPASPPPDPRKTSDATNNVTVIYDEAYDFAYRGELEHAKKLFRKLIRSNDPIFKTISVEWTHIIDEYTRIRDMVTLSSTRKIAEGLWSVYAQQFPKHFIEGMFDPANIAQLLVASISADVTQLPVPSKQTSMSPISLSLMPPPFDWIEIPGKGYSMSKYPTTNAQFAEFIKAGGYNKRDWWTDTGWLVRETEKWKTPRYWHDPQWNKRSLPVVGVSWYEAVAFSLWLSREAGETIALPTEDQWQYAAQGDDGRKYPWGMEWSSDRCNCSVTNARWNGTSPVTQYANLGDSPFGVADMLGNVWEWCMVWEGNQKPLRGGCWRSTVLQIDRRTERKAILSFNLWGFRLLKHHK